MFEMKFPEMRAKEVIGRDEYREAKKKLLAGAKNKGV
jgi:hypothetical protein